MPRPRPTIASESVALARDTSKEKVRPSPMSISLQSYLSCIRTVESTAHDLLSSCRQLNVGVEQEEAVHDEEVPEHRGGCSADAKE